jgi:hypothetical protein
MAERQASEGLAIGDQLNNAFLSVSASLVLARIWQTRGESKRAQEFLQERTTRLNTSSYLLLLSRGDSDDGQRDH